MTASVRRPVRSCDVEVKATLTSMMMTVTMIIIINHYSSVREGVPPIDFGKVDKCVEKN